MTLSKKLERPWIKWKTGGKNLTVPLLIFVLPLFPSFCNLKLARLVFFHIACHATSS